MALALGPIVWDAVIMISYLSKTKLLRMDGQTNESFMILRVRESGGQIDTQWHIETERQNIEVKT